MNEHSANLQREALSDQTSVPTMTRLLLGKDAPRFEVTLNNAKALRAVSSMDEAHFADAYVAGDIDIDGDMLAPYALRGGAEGFSSPHHALALPAAAAFWPGPHQQAGDHRPLRNGPRLLPRLPRSENALLHAGHVRCLLYTSPSPRDGLLSRMPSSA